MFCYRILEKSHTLIFLLFIVWKAGKGALTVDDVGISNFCEPGSLSNPTIFLLLPYLTKLATICTRAAEVHIMRPESFFPEF